MSNYFYDHVLGIYLPTGGDTGEEERRKHVEVEPSTTPATVPAEPVPA